MTEEKEYYYTIILDKKEGDEVIRALTKAVSHFEAERKGEKWTKERWKRFGFRFFSAEFIDMSKVEKGEVVEIY